MGTNSYTVVWEVQLNAESPKDAAEQARQMQLDPVSEAVFFEVTNDNTGAEFSVDLLEGDDEGIN